MVELESGFFYEKFGSLKRVRILKVNTNFCELIEFDKIEYYNSFWANIDKLITKKNNNRMSFLKEIIKELNVDTKQIRFFFEETENGKPREVRVLSSVSDICEVQQISGFASPFWVDTEDLWIKAGDKFRKIRHI